MNDLEVPPISGNLRIPTWKCSSSCKWIYNYIAMEVISQLMGVYTATHGYTLKRG